MRDPEARERALLIAQAALDLKAVDLVLLEVGDLTLMTDYFVIATGTSDRHVRSIADRIQEATREAELKFKPIHVEGEKEGRWLLLDYGDVVVHLFDEDTREYYHLADLWADAPRVPVSLAA